MGMVVRTNTMAINAYRQLGMNNSAVAKSLEKLASGYRINRAGDDAAGLAISEKMKAQITGLETASANAQDGISLIQTAEGNLSEVHDMLNRMVELSTKSANGTYTRTERQALQDEVNQLLDEIDRISQSANFNGAKLLDGTMGMSEAVEVVSQSQATKASTSSLADKVSFVDETTHTNGDKTAAAAPTEFTIDFADIEYASANSGAVKGSLTATIKLDGKDVKFWKDGTGKLGTEVEIKAQAADATAGTAISLTGANIAATANIKYATIGSEVFEVTGTGTTMAFKYAGTITGTAAANSAITADADVKNAAFVPTGNLEITVTPDASADAVTVTNRDNCHVTEIVDPVQKADIHRAGAVLDLSDVQFKAGMKLKIGETEFAVVDEALAAGTQFTAGKICIKDVADADLLQEVTRQLSHQTAQINDKDGTAKTFTIGRGDTVGQIEIEENVQTDPANYGKFTADQLKKAFSLTTIAADAQTKIKLTEQPVSGSTVKIGDSSYVFVDEKLTGNKAPKDQIQVLIGDTAKDTLSNLKDAVSGSTLNDAGDILTISGSSDPKDAAPFVGGSGLTLQIGDTAESFNKMNVQVADMSAKGLGLEGLKQTGIMTEASASNAIDTIKNAINSVSSTRAGLGALQNRLEHTINNLDVAAENLSAANSRIRDTDMAKEMMNYTKMNVLVQSAQAMLAQANQQPQSVLQLLQ